jgi:hypothetical protein
MNTRRKLCTRLTQSIVALSVLLSPAVVPAQTVISEVLYDAASTDNGNVFVELFGSAGTVLDGWLLEGVNGADGSIYRSVALAGVIPADGVFLIADDSGDGTSVIMLSGYWMPWGTGISLPVSSPARGARRRMHRQATVWHVSIHGWTVTTIWPIFSN